MLTLLFLADGMGKDKYMKLLYVVDVYLKKINLLASKQVKYARRDSLCHTSCTLVDFGTVLGKSQRRCYRSACDISSIPARLRSAEEVSQAPLPEPPSPHMSAY